MRYTFREREMIDQAARYEQMASSLRAQAMDSALRRRVQISTKIRRWIDEKLALLST